MFADDEMLKADEAWWTAFVARFADEPVILAWDLLNEPSIGWNSPPMRTKWNDWLKRTYESDAVRLSRAWKCSPESAGPWGNIAVPPAEPRAGDRRLLDYQRFREHIAVEWTRRMTHAIRTADARHLVTVGQIQWAVPVVLPSVGHYAGFDVVATAEPLDFVTIHFYPLASPRPCDGPTVFAQCAIPGRAAASAAAPTTRVRPFGLYAAGGQGGHWNCAASVEHQDDVREL